ncbi:MAG TPA: YraN family protein [Terriglobales bacterium]|nr:YraN family protein [Terriglobales bacterium]
MPARLTRAIIKTLDRLARGTLPSEDTPEHKRTSRCGEEDAYFYLRQLGYVIVARNFRSLRRKGEIDLIGWDAEVLCFVEVKTRTSHEIKPAEAAVDQAKRQELGLVAREYLRRMSLSCQWRFGVVSVYYEDHQTCHPEIELFKNAFSVS